MFIRYFSHKRNYIKNLKLVEMIKLYFLWINSGLEYIPIHLLRNGYQQEVNSSFFFRFKYTHCLVV